MDLKWVFVLIPYICFPSISILLHLLFHSTINSLNFNRMSFGTILLFYYRINIWIRLVYKSKNKQEFLLKINELDLYFIYKWMHLKKATFNCFSTIFIVENKKKKNQNERTINLNPVH